MTDSYAVVGNPVAHSKSPWIHARFAALTGQAMTYAAIDAPLAGFAATVDAFRAGGGRGVNVTAPFKLDACAYADALSDRARRAGAVNALKFTLEGARGENFDGVGLVRDVVHNIGEPIAGRRVLILGAGGAARGIVEPILAEGPSVLRIANRTADKARDLARLFESLGPVVGGGYADAGGAFDMVINATSASWGDSAPPAPASAYAGTALAYELAYGKSLTRFMAAARAGGARRLADGAGMLVEQAAEAFAWWRGVRPPTEAVLAGLTVPLV